VADSDREKLQGSWIYLSLHHRGNQAAQAVVSEYVFRFQGSSYMNKRSGQVQSQGTFRLDPTESPSSIDLLESTGVRICGIYRFEGDKLTVCMDEYERPADFDPQGGKCRSVVVLERMKP
jgi:uncharacterized protein (TIGR03067 family)